jgi:hypothetical protein
VSCERRAEDKGREHGRELEVVTVPEGWSFQLAHVSPTDGAELATFAILGEIERAVWSMPGVTRIDNQLPVT